jgi:hypothetical protein
VRIEDRGRELRVFALIFALPFAALSFYFAVVTAWSWPGSGPGSTRSEPYLPGFGSAPYVVCLGAESSMPVAGFAVVLAIVYAFKVRRPSRLLFLATSAVIVTIAAHLRARIDGPVTFPVNLSGLLLVDVLAPAVGAVIGYALLWLAVRPVRSPGPVGITRSVDLSAPAQP